MKCKSDSNEKFDRRTTFFRVIFNALYDKHNSKRKWRSSLPCATSARPLYACRDRRYSNRRRLYASPSMKSLLFQDRSFNQRRDFSRRSRGNTAVSCLSLFCLEQALKFVSQRAKISKKSDFYYAE